MGYVELAPLFCVATEKVKDRVNNIMASRQTDPAHLLEQLSEISPVGESIDTNQIRFQAD